MDKIRSLIEEQQSINSEIQALQEQLLILIQKEGEVDSRIKKLDFSDKERYREIQIGNRNIDICQLSTNDLPQLPLRIIDQIVQSKYGVHKLKFYSSLDGSQELYLLPEEYREAVIYRLTTTDSCRHCRSLFHSEISCPNLRL